MATQGLSAWDRQELAAWLRLLLTPRIGNASARRLLARFGEPQQIFAAPQAAWESCISPAQATQLARLPDHFDQRCTATWDWLHGAPEGLGRAIITLADPRYPASLLEMADPPLLLYAEGPPGILERAAPLVEMRQCLAIVGSRHPTAQGSSNAQAFAHALAEHGWTVVSGLAAGIDAAAHTGALAAAAHPLATVAVVGTGLDQVYPRQHQALARRIARQGLILSEFHLGTPPLATNFPKRNRIIAGLCGGTLVVEAALASGSLITARLACEQGREVFAIPGSIHAPQARGCHALIRQGAKLVETAQDILEELAAPTRNAAGAPGVTAALPLQPAPPAAAPASHPPEHAALLDALGFDPVGLDALTARTGWGAAQLQAQLLELELEGLVARLPGGQFQRVARA
ncbi:Uncharacterised protein [uncultured Comamonas sp.]|nr:Uncharacterised protein [uncultured Comamonas sp.]